MSVYQRLESIGMAIIETPIGVIKTIPISQMNMYDTRVTNTIIDVFEFEQKPAMWDNFKGTNKIEFDETYKVYVEEIKKQMQSCRTMSLEIRQHISIKIWANYFLSLK